MVVALLESTVRAFWDRIGQFLTVFIQSNHNPVGEGGSPRAGGPPPDGHKMILLFIACKFSIEGSPTKWCLRILLK